MALRARTYGTAVALLLALACGVIAATSSAANAALAGQWTFEDASGQESTGLWSTFTLRGSASIANGELAVAGTGPGENSATAWAQAGGYSGPTITDKTLVAWLRLDNLNAVSGSPLALNKSGGIFDAVVYAERQPNRWMAGSNFFARTQDFPMGKDDTATGTVRQIAISYQSTGQGQQTISGCLDGVSLGSYGASTETFAGSQGAQTLFGPRHLTGVANNTTGSINAHITEARIYDQALSCSQAAALNSDLHVTKSTSPADRVIAGDPVTWTATVRNEGTSDATGVTVSDPLPPQVSDATWTCAASTGSTCASADGSGDISQAGSTVKAGGTITYTITATVKLDATGTLSNTASATLDTGSDTDSTDNSATTSATIQPPAPRVLTGAASNVAPTSATLNATVDPRGQATTYHFEYGTSTAYGQRTADADAGSGTIARAVSGNATGLLPLTNYHFRLVATSAGGTTNGADQLFTTNALAPEVMTLAASDVGQTTAKLNGTVDPSGVATTYHFEFGPGVGYGTRTPDQSAGSGNTAQAVSASLSTLAPGTTYHFRLVATNAAGTVSGGDRTFTTQSPQAKPASPFVSDLTALRRCVRGAQLITPASDAGGLAFSFKLNVKATVKYVIKRRAASPGRRACPKPARNVPGRATEVSTQEREGSADSNTTSLATTAARRTRGLVRKAKAGPTRVALAQIAQARKLAPGTYILYVTATDGFGQTSNITRVKFWVLTDSTG